MKRIPFKELRVNENIRVKEVRLIGQAGEQLGVVPVQRALQMAKEQGLDLVEVAPNTQPVVCRVMDYGKYKYEQTKKLRESRRDHKTVAIREVRLRPKISEHDLEAKTRLVRKLLEEGAKVKVTLVFRGREATHPDLGWKVLQKLAAGLKDVVLEKPPVMESRSIFAVFALSPKKHAGDKKAEEGKVEEKVQGKVEEGKEEKGFINA